MSQLGWWPFGGDSDKETGEKLLSAYYNEAINFPEFPWTSFELWLSHLNSKVPDFDVLIGELVKSNYASTTVDQAMERLRLLANQSGGEASVSQITQAAGGRGDTVNWLAAIPEVAQESVSDVSEALQNVGEGVLGTFKMTKYLPWILLGAGAIFLYAQGSNIKNIVKKVGGQ